MLKLLKDYGGWLLLAVVAAGYNLRRIRGGVTWLLGIQRGIHETQERLADGYQKETTLTERERDRAIAERDALKKALADEVRKVDIRDDINREDRARIRSLRLTVRKLRQQAHSLRLLCVDNSINDSEIADVPRVEEEADDS